MLNWLRRLLRVPTRPTRLLFVLDPEQAEGVRQHLWQARLKGAETVVLFATPEELSSDDIREWPDPDVAVYCSYTVVGISLTVSETLAHFSSCARESYSADTETPPTDR